MPAPTNNLVNLAVTRKFSGIRQDFIRIFYAPDSIQSVTGKLNRIENLMRYAVGTTEAEFGAYMPYSYYLEFGWISYPPRPHIVPAIENNLDWINDTFNRRLFELINYVAERKITAPGEMKRRVSDIWVGVLNERPRQDARYEALRQRVWKYGFHYRTISGYSPLRKISEVVETGRRLNELRQKIAASDPMNDDRLGGALEAKRDLPPF